MNPYEDGYYAGLVNDRANPHSPFVPAFYAWFAGNQAGLTVHCAVVEAAYLHNMQQQEEEELTNG